jgi:glucuronate isomerase
VPYAADFTAATVEAAYRAARDGKTPDADAALQYKSATLLELGRMNHAKGWAQQLHIGPIRNLNSRMAGLLGPDTGYDSVGDAPFARPLAKYLDSLERTGQLAPTVLYTINPAANMVLATMTGNFQDGSVPGKMQFGSGWWFNDQMDGMIRQMEMLSQTGLLSRFVGMLTDSRSFLSYTRHEYFRRILCNMIGADIANGLLPTGYKTYGELVRDVCYNNANAYFGFGLPPR